MLVHIQLIGLSFFLNRFFISFILSRPLQIKDKAYKESIEKKGEAYQLYMYKHAVEEQTGKTVAWYAYYLFPKMELYTEPAGVSPKWEEWIEQRENRLEQLSQSIIEPVVKGSDNDTYPKHIILKNIKMK